MIYPSILIQGRLIKRYKRFLADIQILSTGEMVTAHCPNPGAMLGVTLPGTPVWVRHAPSPTRKLSYTWELSQEEETIVGINTHLPNELVYEALLKDRIASLTGYTLIHREPKVSSRSRLDFKLQNDSLPPCYVEVKSVQMKWKEHAAFPDSPTTRGRKHLDELITLKASGARSMMVFVVQRSDVTSFTLNDDIDPEYKIRFLKARSLGVESCAYKCQVSPLGIDLYQPLSMVI